MRLKMEERREMLRKKAAEEEAANQRKQSNQNPYDLMGEGIANEILGGEDNDVINYPSGYGGSMFNGADMGGGGMSEAEMLEAAIQASLQEMSIAGGEENKSE